MGNLFCNTINLDVIGLDNITLLFRKKHQRKNFLLKEIGLHQKQPLSVALKNCGNFQGKYLM